MDTGEPSRTGPERPWGIWYAGLMCGLVALVVLPAWVLTLVLSTTDRGSAAPLAAMALPVGVLAWALARGKRWTRPLLMAVACAPFLASLPHLRETSGPFLAAALMVTIGIPLGACAFLYGSQAVRAYYAAL